MLDQLRAALGPATRELDLISPYLIPGEEGTEMLGAIVARGVRVRVLTNALAATDTAVVHTGYARYRERLLRDGVQLYELKPGAGEREDSRRPRLGGSSSASLHAKTAAVDRKRVFVGSFNYDPRSQRLNTELGLVMEDTPLAARVSEVFDTRIPDDAYEVRLAADGRGLEWIERTREGEVVYTTEPQTGWPRRLLVQVLSLLPLEPLL